MSLVNCVECERDFSDTRSDCPHCGAYMEGHEPVQVQAVAQVIDPELQEIAVERKFKRNILKALRSLEFSSGLKTFKNGLLKDRRSLGFSYVHGEVLSFNSYMDTDVDVTMGSINEVSSVTTSYGSGSSWVSGVSTRSRSVVESVNVTKTKITEMSIKHENKKVEKYYFRGPEIDFLRPGDPVTIGFLAMDWLNHSDDVSQFDYFGLSHSDGICPVIFINRSQDAPQNSHVVTDSGVFESAIFDSSMPYWKYILGAGVLLDIITGALPFISILTVIGLGVFKFLMTRGQDERIEEYRSWWVEQADDACNATG